MDRARVLAPAIGHAERGVPLTFKNVEFVEAARATLGRSKEAARLYLGDGAPRAGGVVTYRELASTFRQVAEGGAEVFYRGPVGQAIARAVREAGGWLGGRPGGVQAGVARARDHRVSWPADLLDAAAVLRLPDAGDAEHPGRLRPAWVGPQLRRLSASPDRGREAGLRRSPRLRVLA